MVATGKQRREGGTRLVMEEVVKVGLGEASWLRVHLRSNGEEMQGGGREFTWSR